MDQKIGKIILKSAEEMTPEALLDIEQKLNTVVAQEVWERYKIAVRVHL